MSTLILVVDDEPDMTEWLTFNLQQHGYQVKVAHDGPEALERARAVRPALIILNLMLPGMDGFTVCEFLRAGKATATVPVIMLTAVAGEIPRTLGLTSGANAYVTKPFRAADLLQRVASLLRPHYGV